MTALRRLTAMAALLLLAGCSTMHEAEAIGLIGDTGSYMAKSTAEASGGVNSYDISHQPMNKFLPDGISQSDKLRAFLECRRECIAKCDRLVYIYADKKEFCHDCIRQCMMSFLQQARSLGIDFNSQPTGRDQMQGDAPTSDTFDNKKRRGGGEGGGRRGRRDKRKQRRQRRQKERRERQTLLKNCIVHK